MKYQRSKSAKSTIPVTLFRTLYSTFNNITCVELLADFDFNMSKFNFFERTNKCRKYLNNWGKSDKK